MYFGFLFVLVLVVLSLRCCWGLSLVAASGDYSLVGVPGLLTEVASFAVEHRLEACRLSSCGERLSCFLACWIFQDQGSNSCPLHWQAKLDS